MNSKLKIFIIIYFIFLIVLTLFPPSANISESTIVYNFLINHPVSYFNLISITDLILEYFVLTLLFAVIYLSFHKRFNKD
jgi:hypothetical protein